MTINKTVPLELWKVKFQQLENSFQKYKFEKH